MSKVINTKYKPLLGRLGLEKDQTQNSWKIEKPFKLKSPSGMSVYNNRYVGIVPVTSSIFGKLFVAEKQKTIILSDLADKRFSAITRGCSVDTYNTIKDKLIEEVELNIK
ncbi:MAG: hypothetical protein LUH10_11050 [Tannerellaceae bacterium]|nr:hypothetical protein [Tannerellaceae bacterium]